VEFWVFRDDKQPYHQVAVKGALLNAYDLFIENRSLSPGSYQISLAGIKDAELVIARNPVLLQPNSRTEVRVYVFAKRANLRDRITRISFILTNTANALKVVQEAPFVYPERSDQGVEI